MYRLNNIDLLVLIILIIGGINWGLISLFQLDLVAFLFGPMSIESRVVYFLVGLSALYTCYTAYKLKF